MDSYGDRIKNVIGDEDEDLAQLVEDMMRSGRSGLDNLSPAEFTSLTRLSLGLVLELVEAGEIDTYCELIGLNTPAGFAPISEAEPFFFLGGVA